MKIYLASDHAGFELKEQMKARLLDDGYQVEDCGALEFDEGDDYPDFILKAALSVSEDKNSRGIVFGKSGAGECIVANKVKGIRAALGINEENIKLMRLHNDANILGLGSEFVDKDQAYELIKLFLETEFSNEERHIRRINKIQKIEDEI